MCFDPHFVTVITVVNCYSNFGLSVIPCQFCLSPSVINKSFAKF